MSDLARPDGPGCRPSDDAAPRHPGKAASIPCAAKRKSIDELVKDYCKAFRAANNGDSTSKISYENGWIVFRNISGWRTGRYRLRQFAEMTERLFARAASQGIEARSAETLGSARQGESPVGHQADALETKAKSSVSQESAA